jgi:hypothetical protein
MGKIWKNYLESIDLSGNSRDLYEAMYDIGSLFFELFKEYNKESKNKNLIKNNLGLIMYNIAVTEIIEELPYSKSACFLSEDFLQIDIVGDIDMKLEVLLISLDVSKILTDWAEALSKMNFSLLQYSVNRIFEILYDIAVIENINLKDCLKIENTLTEKTDENKNVKNIKNKIFELEPFEKLFKQTKEDIKSENKQEILFDILMDSIETKNNTIKTNYKGLKVRKGRNIFKYETGDLVVDFFNASNFIAKEFAEVDYRFNYTAKLRMIFNLIQKEIFFGYIKDGKLIPINNLDKLGKDIKGTSTKLLDRSYRPILMTKKIKSLDDLLDHVAKANKIVNDKNKK